MGIGFVLIAWAIIGSAGAVFGAFTMFFVAAHFTQGAKVDRRWLLRASAAFPFACLIWGGGVFLFQAAINAIVLHRDVGIGDGFDCPLPNGYALTFIDTTDSGTVYGPLKRPAGSEVKGNRIEDVSVLQLAGSFILGGIDPKSFEHMQQPSNAAHSFFLVDTRTGTKTTFATYDRLYNAAQQEGVRVHLVPIGSVYLKYRFTWFDALAGALLVLPPLAGLGLLARWVFRVRNASALGT